MDGQVFHYRVMAPRPNQRRLILRVQNGVLIVRAPKWTRNSDIERIIANNRDWVTTQLFQAESEYHRPLHVGDTIMYCGFEFTLVDTPHENRRTEVLMDSSNHNMVIGLPMDAPNDAIHHAVYVWLRNQARVRLREILSTLANKHGFEVNRVVVKEQAKRWGSCSTLRNINLNWRLIQAPVHVQEYVAIHELAHLVEMNHSDAFWALVQQMMPTYPASKTWLRTNGATLYNVQPTYATFQR